MIIDTLPPKIAAALAADVYDTLDMPAGAVFTPKDKALSKLFDFSSQGGGYTWPQWRFHVSSRVWVCCSGQRESGGPI